MLWNYLLDCARIYYNATGKFLSRKELYFQIEQSKLFSQVAQNQADRLAKALSRIGQLRKLGRKNGFPRFKKFGKMKIVTYPQRGFKIIGRKVQVSKIGEINIKLHREIEGKIKTLTIKRESSGKWFAIFTVSDLKRKVEPNGKPMVGIDLGLEKLATLSNGATIENPRINKHFERFLKVKSRLLSKKKSGKNYFKAKVKLANVYEKIANKRNDYLHKVSKKLVEEYGVIAIEDLKIEILKQGFLSKSFNDSALGEFMRMLDYKAESAGCRVVRVSAKYTSQDCSNCGTRVFKRLFERSHSCPHCGIILDRDVNAAINILKKATAGMAESNAWRNEINTLNNKKEQISLLNQEA